MTAEKRWAFQGLLSITSIELIKDNEEVDNKNKRAWLEKFKDI